MYRGTKKEKMLSVFYREKDGKIILSYPDLPAKLSVRDRLCKDNVDYLITKITLNIDSDCIEYAVRAINTEGV